VKTIRIADDAHQKLTALLGELTAESMKMQTYTDAIDSLLSQSVMLPPELLAEVEKFMEENKRLGYTTREEFIKDAIRARLKMLTDESEFIEIPREKYERLGKAIKEMDTPYYMVSDFIHGQIDEALEQYEKWKEEKKEEEES